MSNSQTEYDQYVRANLPSGMTWDTDNYRYMINGYPFLTFIDAQTYRNTILLNGWTPPSTGFPYTFPFELE